MNKICKWCKKEYKTYKSKKKYCSRACYSKARIIKVPIIYCFSCGKELTKKQIMAASYKKRTRMFCSNICANKILAKEMGNKNKGRKQSKKHLDSLSKVRKGRIPWNKGMRSKEANMFCHNCGKGLEDYQIRNRQKYCSCKCYQESASCKWIQYNGWHPNYNTKSIRWLRGLDKLCFDETGMYATKISGEHYIADLDYWLDYISHQHKVIIEWDEKHHYSANGTLKDKDAIRQSKIQTYYPDYLFLRLKQDSLIGE